jgi:hypothetical protein
MPRHLDQDTALAAARPGTAPLREHQRELAKRHDELRRKIADGTLTLADLDGLAFATVYEVAAIFRIDPRTVRRRVADGSIPSLDLGEYRIPAAWLREQARAGAAA